jgi:hypothetical protein
MPRHLCCLVVAEGPDPTGAVAAAVPFHGSSSSSSSSGAGAGVALSCSGVVLGGGGGDGEKDPLLMATPLSLLSPFLSQGAVAAVIDSNNGRHSGGGANSDALLPLAPPPGVSLRVLLPPPNDEDDNNNTNEGRWESAEVIRAARLPACAATLRAALGRLRAAEPAAAARWRLGWALGGNNNSAGLDDEASADEAATFLVLRIRGRRGRAAGAKSTPPLCRCSLGAAHGVVAWGSPFGALAPFHFAHSAVAGVVSGVLGPPSSSVLRLDVAALPGMEGGPVACARCGGLAAVLSRPLVRGGAGGSAGAAAEVPLAFPAELLMEACVAAGVVGTAALAAPAAKPPSSSSAAAAGVERALSTGVVMVRCGGAWATGVVMPRDSASPSPVLVLTIAHLFDHQPAAGAAAPPPSDVGVRVTCPSTNRHAWSSSTLLLHRFRSPHLDLAVLAVPYPGEGEDDAALVGGLDALAPLELLPPSSPSSAPPRPVVVAGHGLFGPSLGWAPAATSGTLARVVASSAAADPVMALTTAQVHAGCSGGAVLCASSGRLAAIATSNSRHVLASGGGATTTLPRWNYAVPASALRLLWRWAEDEAEESRRRRGGRQNFDASRARAALRAMDRAAMVEGGEAAARVWALLPPAAADEEQGAKLRARL